MAGLRLIDRADGNAGEATLDDDVFGIEPDGNVVFDAVIRQRASIRQGTHVIKNRLAVRGGGKKPWRQKDTGRVRQGSIRTSRWCGGGIIFGPIPRLYAYSSPRGVRRLAIKSVLPQKLRDNSLIVLDRLSLDTPKTRKFKAILGNLNVDSKVLVASSNENVQPSARNLESVKVVPVNGLNVIDTVNYDKLILTQDAVKRIEKVLTW